MNAKIRKRFGDKPIVWVAAWGISKLRKRTGKFAGSIRGEALWFDAWYDRFMSRDTAEKLAGLGVNLVVLPFSVGGDADTEKRERDDFARMTEFLREYGITSLPYLQYQNILQEYHALPGDRWAVGLDGGKTCYAYWRRTYCQSAPEFIDYFKGLITDAIGRGADGVWIDNNYLRICRCEGCVAGFRDYLRAHNAYLLDELSLKDFDRVETPPSLNEFDPIAQALVEYNCERNINIHKELKRHLESLSPDALFGSNPALYRGDSLFARGVDLKALVELNDLMYLENKFAPRETGGQLTGNYHGFIACRQVGSMGVPGAWKREDYDSTSRVRASGLPETEGEIRRCLFEATAFGGALGLFWAVRNIPEQLATSAADMMKCYFELPVIAEATKKTLDFLRLLPVYGENRSLSPVAVVYHRDSLRLNFNDTWPSVHAIEEALALAGVPYDVVFSEAMSELKSYPLAILPEPGAIGDGDAAFFADYVAAGGGLLVIGDAGFHDDRNRQRIDYALKDLLNVSFYERKNEIVRHRHGKGTTVWLPNAGPTETPIRDMMSAAPGQQRVPEWTRRKDELITIVRELIGDRLLVSVEADGHVAMSASALEDGRKAFQFLDYRPDAATRDLKIKIRTTVFTGKPEAQWHTPDYPALAVSPIENEKDFQVFALPGFKDYGALIVRASSR